MAFEREPFVPKITHSPGKSAPPQVIAGKEIVRLNLSARLMLGAVRQGRATKGFAIHVFRDLGAMRVGLSAPVADGDVTVCDNGNCAGLRRAIESMGVKCAQGLRWQVRRIDGADGIVAFVQLTTKGASGG